MNSQDKISSSLSVITINVNGQNSNIKNREFPGGLVLRILGFHCHGPVSVPGQGTEIPQATQQNKQKKPTPLTPHTKEVR